jgi:hypothetical protein
MRSPLAALAALAALMAAGCGSSTKTVTVTASARSATSSTPPATSTTPTTVTTPTTAATTSTATGTPKSASVVALGQPGDIGDGWALKVERMSSTATGAPTGGREVTVSVVLAYRGAGESVPPVGVGRFPYVEGSHGAPYLWAECAAPDYGLRAEVDSGLGLKMFSGTQHRSRICFLVAADDVSSLELHLGSASTSGGRKLPSATFALR